MILNILLLSYSLSSMSTNLIFSERVFNVDIFHEILESKTFRTI